jgi:amidase
MSEIDAKIQTDYDPDFYHRAPVSLQLVGKRLEEEKVLEMVEIVADALKNQP